MESKAKASFIRMTPRKVGLVARLIRGKTVAEALSQLQWVKKASAPVLEKVVKSAFANFQKKQVSTKPEDVRVVDLTVNGGPMFKIFIPRAQGRASTVRKRSCHISVVLSDQSMKKGS